MTVSTEQEELARLLYGLCFQPLQQHSPDFSKQRKRVIVLAGPTGSGKTELGLMIARLVGGEIISADAMQVYRGMDIGTAKVSKEERLEVVHHMIDIRDVHERFNVVDFYYEARQCCKEILERNNVPIIIGGSGFYVHTFLYGPPAGPRPIPEVREQIESELEQLGANALFERLQGLDPDYANTITVHDRQKIVRALEIIKLTNRKVSQLKWHDRHRPIEYDFRCWFIHRPRDVLYSRIDERCEDMLAQGLLDEVQELIEMGIHTNPSAAQAIGYRQSLEYLQTKQTSDDYDTYIQKFKQSSRRYAKRQFTWFRKEPLFRWLDVELHDPETAMDIILKDFESL